MPRVRVNGQWRQVEEGTSVAELLEQLGLRREGIAVEVNREVVPRSLHSQRRLEEGDEVEVVTFVGGG